MCSPFSILPDVSTSENGKKNIQLQLNPGAHLIAHFARHSWGEPPSNLAKDAIHRPSGQRMPIILQQIIFVEQEVVVRV